MADAILSVVKDNRRRRSFCEGTEGPLANDVKALQREAAHDKHDIAKCAQGLLKLQEELRQMQDWAAKSEERSAKSEERAAKTGEQMEGQSLELQQLRDELNELREKAKGWSHMQEGVKREEAKVEKVKTQPPILGTDAEHANVQLQKEEVKSVLNFVSKSADEHEQLKESIWISVFFIGSPLLDLGGTLITIVLLFFNICIQCVFSGIVSNKFTDDPFDKETLLALDKWRKTIAHDYINMDPVSGASLASRVCIGSSEKSLSISTEQQTTLGLIRNYLPDTNQGMLGQALSGPTMCVIALVLWFSCIVREMQELITLVSSVYALPTNKSMIFDSESGQLEIQGISFTRKILIYFMAFVRVAICVILCVFGTQYVVYTVSVQELLLNCVALEFVLEVDELLFESFAPSRLLQSIRAVLPLKKHKVSSYRGADATSITYLSLVVGAVVLVSLTSLIPLVDRIYVAERYLCDGKLDFVYTSSASGRIFWTATPPAASTSDFSAYQEQFVEDVLDENINPYGYVRSVAEIRSFSNQRTDDAFATCLDRLDDSKIHQRVIQTQAHDFLTHGTAPFEFLQAGGLAAQDLLHMNRCQPFSWLCQHVGDFGLQMRMLCPQTCGCDMPGRFVVDRRASTGCYDSCAAIAMNIVSSDRSVCRDTNLFAIRSHEFTKELGEYTRRLQSLSRNSAEHEQAFFFRFHEMLHEYGCDAILTFDELYKTSVCQHNAFEFFLQHNCPEACGCGDNWKTIMSGSSSCPKSCFLNLIRQAILPKAGGAEEQAQSLSENQEEKNKDDERAGVVADNVTANSSSATTMTSTRASTELVGVIGARHRRRR